LFHDTVAINLLITSRSKVTQDRNRLKGQHKQAKILRWRLRRRKCHRSTFWIKILQT